MNRLKRKLIWLYCGLALFAGGLATLWAAEEDVVVFEQPKDVILAWAQRACLLVTILSVVLILSILLLRRNRLMEASSKWLLFLGLCVLPVPVAFLSSGIGMEESKNVEFCHSCHASMDPFVNDMMNEESETLAALHYKNRYIQHEQCWQCHSDYGIAGTADAKMTGMLHIYKFTFNGSFLPGSSWKAPIKLYHPYKWTICLECHANSSLFKAPRNDETAHEGVLEGVMKGEIGCTDCHQSAHPAPEERS